MKRATPKQKLERLKWVCSVAYQCAGVLTDSEWSCSRKQGTQLMDMLSAASAGETYKAWKIANKLLPFGCMAPKTKRASK